MASENPKKPLSRTATLAALGEASAGVTHEVRNAMTGILGLAQVARGRVHTRPDSVAELLGLIEQESQRCVDLLSEFLRFTRPYERARSTIELGAVVAEVHVLMAQQFDVNGVTLETDVAVDVPRVTADAGQMKQVVINLVLNAMHAVRAHRGRVVVRTRRGGAGLVELVVHDDGPGVAPELSERVFEPFFTTKPNGVGTGLGLAVSRKIVEEHGGSLTLEIGVASGAMFVLRLPGVEA